MSGKTLFLRHNKKSSWLIELQDSFKDNILRKTMFYFDCLHCVRPLLKQQNGKMICINLVWPALLVNQITEFFDIWNKVNGFQSSWVKRLYDDCLLEWRIILLYQLKKTFVSSSKFHSNLLINLPWRNCFLFIGIC